MTTVSFSTSYASDFYCFLSKSKEKKVSSVFRKLEKREDIFSGSFEDIERSLTAFPLPPKQKALGKEANKTFSEKWQKSLVTIEEKRKEAEKQWRQKENEFFAYTEDLTKRKFETESIDCLILLSEEGKDILSPKKIYIGVGMPDSLLGWSCAYGYLSLFIGDQLLSRELELKKAMKKGAFDAFSSIAVSLVLMDSPFSISERNEMFSWCLSYDKNEWEILKRCYPLWLSRETFSGFVDECKKVL